MSNYIPASVRALEVWRAILGNATQVVFTRPKVTTKTGTTSANTSPQTVRIESDSGPTVVEGVAGAAPRRQAYVVGVRQHPTVAETDMEEGYEFDFNGDHYRITDVILRPGEKQGTAVVTG